MLMTKQIRELRNLILERESVLRAKMDKTILGQLGHGAPNLAASAGAPSVPPATNLPEGPDIGMLAQGADELLAIEAAKRRMKDHTYGLCIVCSGPIGFKRLLALPTAERCLMCQEDRERAAPDGPRAVH